MIFKTETHLHTAPVSGCSRLSPTEMIRLYAEAGYTTVFVSDHFAKDHLERLGGELTWNQKINRLYGAYQEAKAVGETFGIHVLFSPEMTLAGNHYLLYGTDPAFLQLREDIFDISLQDFHRHAKKHGITIIQAHPFRDGICTPQPDVIDGIEAINTNPRHEDYEERCMELARRYHLPITAGSDAHRPEDIAKAAVLSHTPITSTEEYLTLLKSGKLRLMKNGELI